MNTKKIINNQKGFTLLEILVSVGIVATLSAAVSPTVFQHVKESRITRAQSDAAVIGDAVSRFRGDMDEWPVYANGGTRTHGAIGILYGETGSWPRIDMAADASCDFDGDGIVDQSGDDVDVAPLGDFPGPGDTDLNGNGTLDLGSELSVANCESIFPGMYTGWVPFGDPAGAATAIQSVSDGCSSLFTRVTDPPELASVASLGSQLVENVPSEARTGVAGSDSFHTGTSPGGEELVSMVQNNAACSENPPISIVRANQYPFKDPGEPGKAGWNGPYLEEIPKDPWGNRFLVNIHYATAEHGDVTGHENNQIKVVSAGPNGLLETPTGATGIGAPGASVSTEAGGDDVVHVFHYSMRTTM